MFLEGMLFGAVIGFGIAAFIIATSENTRQHEAYTRGYEDGKKAREKND